MILNDMEIERLCLEQQMITPFVNEQVSQDDGHRVISYGLSSFGYDIRLAEEFHTLNTPTPIVIDPKNFEKSNIVIHPATKSFTIAANGFVLALTKEYFRIPEDIMTLCVGKSTYARCGIIVNVTPFEPGWEGYAVLEISNTAPIPAKIYPNEGIAQVIFFRGERPAVTYADKKGKYQKQTGMTYAKV